MTPELYAGAFVILLAVAAAVVPRIKRTPPTLEIDDERITLRAPGRVESVAWRDVVEIGIVTTADGPYAEDFYWLLIGEHGDGCAITNELACETSLLDELGKRFDNLDFEAIIRASGCCEEASFLVWRR